ncbi:MarR family transcriptional regulator [Nocardia jiangsuensis]|uniref:MarR family transcriptional regulator n=1 Tax=Nocardia jiangsuensis TaxID=1691563 RepID=A0ABV8DP91_9NOCA
MRRDLLDELRRYAAQSVVFHSNLASRLGIRVIDLGCLIMLSTDGPLTPGELATRLGISRGGAITSVIDRLEGAGFVRRSPDDSDRRRVRVEPVAVRAGVAIAPVVGVLGNEFPSDPETLDVVLGFLHTMNTALQASNEQFSRS